MSPSSNNGKSDAEARILAAAATLFAQCGYAGVSTRDIASAADVNEVTVYRHFPHKRDLYLATLESVLQQVRLSGDLLAKIAEARDGRTVLARTFELIAAGLMQKPELVRLVQYSALEFGVDIDPLLRRHLGEFVEVVARYLEPWIDNGQLRCPSAKGLVFALVAIVISHRSLHRVFSGNMPAPEMMFDAYLNLTVSQGTTSA
jgi:AcrR family transcriptional regulator